MMIHAQKLLWILVFSSLELSHSFLHLPLSRHDASLQVPAAVLGSIRCQAIDDGQHAVRNVHAIIPTEAGYLLVDPNGRQVVEVDSSLAAVRSFGKDTFVMPFAAARHGNRVYVSDFKGVMWVFAKEGDLIKEIKLQERPKLSRFAIKDDRLYYTTPSPTGAIQTLDLEGTPLAEWGGSTGDLRAIGHLFAYREEIIRVGIIDPVIERYTSSGTLLETYDLASNIPFVRQTADLVKRRYETEGRNYQQSTIPVIKDAYLLDDKLYLLVREVNENRDALNPLNCRKLVILHLGATEITLGAIFDLAPEGSSKIFSAICVADQGRTLLAFSFDSDDSELCVFSF